MRSPPETSWPKPSYAAGTADGGTGSGGSRRCAAQADLADAVLQYLASARVIERYLYEFVRVLKVDGLLIFQQPSLIPSHTECSSGARPT